MSSKGSFFSEAVGAPVVPPADTSIPPSSGNTAAKSSMFSEIGPSPSLANPTIPIPQPSTGSGLGDFLRVNLAKTAYELRTPSQVLTDLGLFDPALANELDYVRVNAAGTAFEPRTPAQVKADLAIAYTDISGLAAVAHSGSYTDLINNPIPVPAVGNELNFIRVNATGTAYEAQTPTQVKTDLGLATVASTGSYTDLINSPLPAPAVANELDYIRVNSTGTAYEVRTTTQVKTDLGLATVATSGAYADLTGKPTLGTASADNVATQAQLDAGTASVIPTADLFVGHFPHGQCRLVLSGANLVLQPRNGNKLVINNQLCAVPDAGVSLAPTGAVASTTYYIYAFMNAGVMTLEFSTTGHSAQAGTGVEIKTGDATRTLVGMARAIAGPAWATTPTLVVSWFNRQPLTTSSAFTANRTTASTTFVELNSEIRGEFLTWGDVQITSNGSTISNSAGVANDVSIGIDGASPEDVWQRVTLPAANNGYAFSLSHKKAVAEGYHYATLLGLVSGGIGTWYGAASPPTRCTLNVMVNG